MPSTFLTGLVLAASRIASKLVFQQAFQFVSIPDLLAIGLFAKFVEHFTGGCVAEVGADESGFEIVERRTINFFAEGNNFFDALAEIFAGPRDRLFHAVEEARFLLFVQAAKKSLNHRDWK